MQTVKCGVPGAARSVRSAGRRPQCAGQARAAALFAGCRRARMLSVTFVFTALQRGIIVLPSERVCPPHSVFCTYAPRSKTWGAHRRLAVKIYAR